MPTATVFLSAIIALAPALIRWWRGRALVRRADDPALPERLLENRRRGQAIFFCCVVALIAFDSSDAWWSLPLLVLARGIVGYPLRKRLYGETWSLAAYLSFFGRLVLGIYGFWIVLLMAPLAASLTPLPPWIVELAAAVLLLAWNERGTEILRWLLRTQPIQDPALLSRFESMARTACGDRLPHFELVDLRGGAVANAVALPSLHGSGVAFTSTLLALLDRDEIVAICAHELGHLEYYDRKRLRTARIVNIGLIVLACGTPAVSRLVMPSFSWLVEAPLIFAVIATLIWRAKDRQKNETTSDLRAVALCGDAEALARGLTRLYAFARVPRRWDAQHERQATHPSLARRIRDIRAASGGAAAAIVQSAAFAAADQRTEVVFDEGRLEWREHEGITHSIGYGALSELRVHAHAFGPARLVAVEKGGRRWEMTPRAEDVARIQSVLDSVDGKLASVTAPRFGPNVVRIGTLIGLMLTCMVGQIACAFVTLLALIRPQSNLLVAAGVASMTTAALALRERFVEPSPIQIGIAAIMAAIGAGLLFLARYSRRDETRALATRPVASLGIVSALLLLLLAVDGLNPIRLHQNAAAMPPITISLLAFAGALAADRRRFVRRAATVPAALGLAVAAAGSMTFLDRVARDPFLVPADPARIETFSGSPATEFRASFAVSEVRLSPGGRAVALVQEHNDYNDDADAPRSATFHIGPIGGALRAVTADEVVFIDDDRALAVQAAGDAAEIRRFAVADPEAVDWRERVSGLTSGTLRIGRDRNEWQFVGWTHAKGIIRAAGRIGQSGSTITEWPASASRYGWTQAVSAASRDAVILDTSYDRMPFSSPLLIGFYSAFSSHSESKLWHAVANERSIAALSRLEVNCETSPQADAGLICAAFDGWRTRIVTIDPVTARITPVSTLWGRFRSASVAGSEWIAGWLDSMPFALRIATNEALQIHPPPREWIRAVGVTSGMLGTASYGRGDSIVRIYRLAERSAMK